MKKYDRYRHLFQPLKVGNHVLKNRLQFSPMVNPMTSYDGEVTDNYVDFVDMQAGTGVGLVTIGATSVDHDTGEDFAGELDVTDDKKMIGLARLPEAAHARGAKLSVELVHAGRGANPALLRKPDAIAPTPFPTSWGSRHIREMNRRDMDEVVAHYTDVVDRLCRCGFDMIMMHAAHGNLLAQFLSPLTNHRSDYYGGSFENRCRFPLEVLASVRDRIGGRMAVEMRISGDETVPGGMRIEETIEFIKLAQKYIDLVHISGGLVVEPLTMYTTMPPYFSPYGVFVPNAEKVKKCAEIRIPVAAVGCITTLELADEIVGKGQADLIAMARAHLADPELIQKSYQGFPETVRPCLRCWACAGSSHHIRCAVNPALGRTGIYKSVVPAGKIKKTVVIGGGPAGMTAARTLRERGHKVILFEKNNRLGGLLNDISRLPFKEDLRRYTAWCIRATETCGAELRLNTEATVEKVMSEEPDVIFMAAGSLFFIPEIPGINSPKVVHVLDADTGRVTAGKRVVVCGGGASGVECALALAMDGRDVTIVDMIPAGSFASGMEEIPRWMVESKYIREYGIKLMGESKVVAITGDGVEVEDRSWRHSLLPADTVVSAFGMVPNKNFAEQFKNLASEVYVVGDCDHVESIKSANHTAYNYAVHV
jgi:2,4-dienoyl-CoA reductase-like NADH-dependent reductase (Old Yellow Enzyme family)/thioredoxin reductase